MRSVRAPSTRAYRVLLWCYPRGFRREYGGDLVQAFRDELRERGAVRGWMRVVTDLVVSVPRLNLEALMARESSFSALARLIVLGAAAVGLFAFGGVFSLAALAIIIALTSLYWRGRVRYRDALREGSARWWRYLLVGIGLLVCIGIATNYGPDFDWFPWGGLVALFLIGWGLIGFGLLLGVVNLARVVRGRAAGAS